MIRIHSPGKVVVTPVREEILHQRRAVQFIPLGLHFRIPLQKIHPVCFTRDTLRDKAQFQTCHKRQALVNDLNFTSRAKLTLSLIKQVGCKESLWFNGNKEQLAM